jgi:Family of unknown function (DUF6452)
MLKNISTCLIWIIAGVLAGCCCSCPVPNDSVFVRFRNEAGIPKYLPYKRVFGIGGKGDLRQERRDSIQQIMLPISLKTNQVSFVFESDNRKDTLSFQYQAQPFYDRNCGYQVSLDSLKIVSPTTFQKTLTNVDYAIEIIL